MQVPILLIVFGSIVFSLKMILDYRRDRITAIGSRPNREEGSLGASELKRLIREAVDDSVRPLTERVRELESAVRRLPEQRMKALPAASSEPSEIRPEEVDSTIDVPSHA